MDLFSFLESEDYKKSDNVHYGYRIEQLQVLNWGTFHNKIWTFDLGGNTSLLTGDIGSGKSTLVDAITALLVPTNKIKFNMAAGANHNERNFKTYVLGNYGQDKANEGKGKALTLRSYKNYSVILAVFKNKALGEVVTLAQFFYFSDQNKNPERFFVVADKQLSIEKDFSNFNNDYRYLKKRLKETTQVFDQFNQYSIIFRKLLGNLNNQAIDIFSQTISMKKVDELTSFVRKSILEPVDLSQSVDRLLDHYHDLNDSYNAILKAKRQIDFLKPIKDINTRYNKLKDKETIINESKNNLDIYFASKKELLYKEDITKNERLYAQTKETLSKYRNNKKEIEKEIEDIRLEIIQNDGNLIDKLKSDITTLEGNHKIKNNLLNNYINDINILNYNLDQKEISFKENYNKANTLKEELFNKENILVENIAINSTNIIKEKEVNNNIKQEIISLKNRKNNIPSAYILLKEKMAHDLSININDISFVGELVKVKDDQLLWEGAIERLLHNFGLSLIVPTIHYQAVSKWVNNNNLKSKLVYYKVDTNINYKSNEEVNENSIINKVEIIQNTIFYKWINNELINRFNYYASDDMASFYQNKKAITSTGQIKSFSRHEKDDRKLINDKSSFILGFTNQRKILMLEELLVISSKKLDEYESEKKSLDIEYKDCRNMLIAINNVIRVKEFDDIDIYSIESKIIIIKEKITDIEKNNDKLRLLNSKLNDLKNIKDKLDNDISDFNFQVKTQEQNLDALKESQSLNNVILSSVSDIDFAYLDSIKNIATTLRSLTLKNEVEYDKDYREYLYNELQSILDKKAKQESQINQKILKYKIEYPLETKDIDEDIMSVPELLDSLSILMKEDLPKFEKKFKEKLQTNLIKDIANFNYELKTEYNNITKKIGIINKALSQIDYNAGRYIQIEHEDTQDSEIKFFKAKLRECTSNTSQSFDDVDVATAKFNEIKELLDRFQGRQNEAEYDKKWRNKVIDVRNWALFNASERYNDTHELYEFYTDSGGKSGGQKEKLAYTILAAGLAYNFGLSNEDTKENSFRFVVIDEAFLKSSDDSAKYGLTLFKELDFQLLVVTPLAKIKTIEPFISNVGYVSNNPDTHNSQLLSLTIDEYKKRAKEFIK